MPGLCQAYPHAHLVRQVLPGDTGVDRPAVGYAPGLGTVVTRAQSRAPGAETDLGKRVEGLGWPSLRTSTLRRISIHPCTCDRVPCLPFRRLLRKKPGGEPEQTLGRQGAVDSDRCLRAARWPSTNQCDQARLVSSAPSGTGV